MKVIMLAEALLPLSGHVPGMIKELEQGFRSNACKHVNKYKMHVFMCMQ